ncbi:transporter substrate-binding domain-containing protein [Deltaproteobacteria bacterium TL4]
MRRHHTEIKLGAMIFILCFFWTQSVFSATLEQIKARKKLYIGFTEDSLNTVHYSLFQAFAQYLKVELVVRPYTWEEFLKTPPKESQKPSLQATSSVSDDIFEQVDILSMHELVAEPYQQQFDFVENIVSTELLIVNSEQQNLLKYAQLRGKRIAFLQHTATENYLSEINKNIGGGIVFQPTNSDQEAQTLLADRQVEGLVLNSITAFKFLHTHPDLMSVFSISALKKGVWGLKKNNKTLQQALQKFILEMGKYEKLNPIFIQHFGIEYANYLDRLRSLAQFSYRNLEQIQKDGKLYVAMTTEGMNSLNYPLVNQFARSIGVEAVIFPTTWENLFHRQGQIPQGLQEDPNVFYTPDIFKYVDFVAEYFTLNEWGKKIFDYAGTILFTDFLVVPKQGPAIQKYEDLKNRRLAFRDERSWAERLKTINKRVSGSLLLQPVSSLLESKKLLQERKVDGIMLGAEQALKFTWEFPEFKLTIPISPVKKAGWALQKNNRQLIDSIETFFENSLSEGPLDQTFKNNMGITYADYVQVLNQYAAPSARSLKQIKRSGKLYVAFTKETLNSPHYLLAQEFANYLKVKLVPVPVQWEDYFDRNEQPHQDSTPSPIKGTLRIFNKVDLIADNFSMSAEQHTFFDFAETILSTSLGIRSKLFKKGAQKNSKWGIVAKRNSPLPSAFVEQLRTEGTTLLECASLDELQQLLLQGQVEGAIMEGYQALQWEKNNLDFLIDGPVKPASYRGWAVEKSNYELLSKIKTFMTSILANGILDKIFIESNNMRYYQYLERLGIKNPETFTSTRPVRDLDEIIKSGKLIVAVRDRDIVYHNEGKKQFYQRLVEEFAKYLGVTIELVVTPNFSQYWENERGVILKGKSYIPEWFYHFDLAAEAFAELDWRVNKVDLVLIFPHLTTVVARKDTEIYAIQDLENLRGVTLKGSRYEDILTNNQLTHYHYNEVNNFIPDLLEHKADYIIYGDAYSLIPEYSELEVKLFLGKPQKSGWGVKKNQPQLKHKIIEFVEQARKTGLIAELYQQQTEMSLDKAENFQSTYNQTNQSIHLPFFAYTTKNGLPQEDVLSMLQDHSGNMWFSTFSGVVKYNGRHMEVTDLNSGLKSNTIHQIAQDKEGSIYLATSRGVSVIKNHQTDTLYPQLSFKGIHIDDQNRKWFYGNEGLFLYSPEKEPKARFLSINATYSPLPKKIHAVTQVPQSENLLVSTTGGLFLFSESKGLRRLSDLQTFYALVDRQQRVWISTEEGLFLSALNALMDGQLGKQINAQLNLPKEQFSQIVEAHDDSIWLLSQSTLFQVVFLNQRAIPYHHNAGLKGKRLYAFFEDRESNRWIGLSGGIYKLSNQSMRIISPEILNSRVAHVLEDRKQRIWIETESTLYYFDNSLKDFSKKFPEFHKNTLVSLFPKGNLLMVNNQGLVEIKWESLEILRKRQFSKPLSNLTKVTISEQGQIFLLTGNEGRIYYLHDFYAAPLPLENEFTSLVNQLEPFNKTTVGGSCSGLLRYSDNEFKPLVLLENTVWSIHREFLPGNIGERLWVGTENGLGLYQEGQYKKSTFTKLSINSITSAQEDRYLWLGTQKGVVYYDKESDKPVFTLDVKDGLPGNEITTDGLFVDSQGVLWIGTYHGLATFDWNERKQNLKAPDVHIEKILLNGQDLPEAKSTTFTAEENNFVFEITGISFQDEKALEYQFFMEGMEKDYSESLGQAYRAVYNNLPPGDYKFVYRARGKNAVWSPYQSYQFIIKKPFRLTLLGILLQVLGGLIVLFLAIRFFVYIKLRESEREKAWLSYTSESFQRFVPRDFLEHLQRESILEVELGDHTQLTMSVLFSDIRSFTTLSESMSPEENFKFINSYLGRIAPIIRNNHGFIDKYIGDAIMALFGNEADDAVQGAIDMLHELEDYNQGRKGAGYSAIKIGIGINTGELMLGTVGEAGRMEGTVISDSVNLASRVEGMTKMYGVAILITERTVHSLRNPSKYALRVIDRVKVKGKTEPVTIYEVFDCDPPQIKALKLATQARFEKAIALYSAHEFEKAEQIFQACYNENPDDHSIKVYIDRCQYFIKTGWDKNWDGVTALDTK